MQPRLSAFTKGLQSGTDRKNFLEQWVANGAGKQAGPFKFACRCEHNVTATESTQEAVVENYLARPKILQLNGMEMGDFSTQAEALATADALIQMSEEAFGHTHPLPCSMPTPPAPRVLCLWQRQEEVQNNR